MYEFGVSADGIVSRLAGVAIFIKGIGERSSIQAIVVPTLHASYEERRRSYRLDIERRERPDTTRPIDRGSGSLAQRCAGTALGGRGSARARATADDRRRDRDFRAGPAGRRKAGQPCRNAGRSAHGGAAFGAAGGLGSPRRGLRRNRWQVGGRQRRDRAGVVAGGPDRAGGNRRDGRRAELLAHGEDDRSD